VARVTPGPQPTVLRRRGSPGSGGMRAVIRPDPNPSPSRKGARAMSTKPAVLSHARCSRSVYDSPAAKVLRKIRLEPTAHYTAGVSHGPPVVGRAGNGGGTSDTVPRQTLRDCRAPPSPGVRGAISLSWRRRSTQAPHAAGGQRRVDGVGAAHLHSACATAPVAQRQHREALPGLSGQKAVALCITAVAEIRALRPMTRTEPMEAARPGGGRMDTCSFRRRNCLGSARAACNTRMGKRFTIRRSAGVAWLGRAL